MGNIISIHQQQKFSFKRAVELLPIIYRITETAQKEVKNLVNRMEAVKDFSPNEAQKVDLQIQQEVSRWQKKVENLGALAKGLWLADFDNGSGYYCWRFPETEIKYWHKYDEGYSGRKLIENENSHSPNQHIPWKLPAELPQDH